MDEPLAGIPEFVAVADARGFSAAARRLGVAKPLLSERVARLERRLGVRLFHRSTRKLALTEAGQLYREHAGRILAEAAAAEVMLQALSGEPRGLLRVTAPVHCANVLVAPLLPAFRAVHAEILVEVIADDELRDLTGEAVDVAIRFALLEQPSTVARRLAPLRYLLCASPAYLARRGVPDRPEALRAHDCLLYSAAPAWDEWVFRDRARAGGITRVRPTGPVRSSSGTVLREVAVAGGGIALLSTFNAGDELRAGRLLPVLPDWPLAGLDGRAIWAVYTGRRAIPPKTRAFVDFLARHIGDPPYWDREL